MVVGQLSPFSAASAWGTTERRDKQSKLQNTMETQELLIRIATALALVAALVLFFRYNRFGAPNETAASTGDTAQSSEVKKTKPKKTKTPHKAGHNIPDTNRHAETQAPPHTKELFVDFVKGVNRHVDCIAIAPHAHLIATTTADAKVHVVLDTTRTYFLNFREDSFSALDFWCKERQQEGCAFVCGAMATDGRMVCFEIKYGDKKITGMREVLRSKMPMQKGVVSQLVSSRAPWIITCSEGSDTEMRVHSYEGDLLATVDTRQVQNLQLSVSGDGW